MSTAEIRNKLIDQIKLSQDKKLLEELYQYLNQDNLTQQSYQLNQEQLSAVEEARAQVKRGNYLESDEADREIDSWLEK